jgi:hypothetical protein
VGQRREHTSQLNPRGPTYMPQILHNNLCDPLQISTRVHVLGIARFDIELIVWAKILKILIYGYLCHVIRCEMGTES